MNVADAIVAVLKEEGIDTMIAYPVNHIIEAAARADIRTVIVRQERIGIHMADAMARLSSGKTIGVFAMQHGPGTENAFGGVAQAYSESVPILILPMGYPRDIAHIHPNFNAVENFRFVTKSIEPLTTPEQVTLVNADHPGELKYTPTFHTRSGPDPQSVEAAAEVLVNAKRPVIYAGQGVHYAKAWEPLKRLAERLAAPVTTSISGKSAFPENHPLSLGTAGRAMGRPVHDYLHNSDVIFGIGCSFTTTSFGAKMPTDKTVVHATLDPVDLNKNMIAQHAMIGDAGLTLEALNEAVDERLGNRVPDAAPIAADIAQGKEAWLSEWMHKLTSQETPLSPYRVLWDLAHTVDRENCIITHDAGSPRDQITPFWDAITPLSYIGWGKTTQLGYGLGLAMGAKLAHPDRLCINVWGDAAIGFTGMDFETAVRERIPILSILLNNFSMAIELPIMKVATEKYRSTDISGDYAAMAKAFGGYGERVTEPDEIIPAIQRGIEQTQNGTPALLEFITSQENTVSIFN
jgi:acetolactate synthase-1/2/3 large subunit